MFLWFFDGKEAFWPISCTCLTKRSFQMIAHLDRNILKIVKQFLVIIGASLSEPHHRRSTVKSVFLLASLLASSLIWMIVVYISTT